MINIILIPKNLHDTQKLIIKADQEGIKYYTGAAQ